MIKTEKKRRLLPLIIWIKQNKVKILAILFWLLVWELLSLKIQNNIFLVSPFGVVESLIELGKTAEFWSTILHSFIKISTGFIAAVVIGSILAVITCRYLLLKEIVLVFMQTIKSIPVASFVILALLWVRAKNLSILISFLMVLPIIYINVMKGIESVSKELLEMAVVFRIPKGRKIRFLYLPSVIPYFISACSVGLGFCWKSGVAAEVISLADNSIGERLYEAKLYLNTEHLFAWTVVIVIISAVFEKLILKFIIWIAEKRKQSLLHGR